MELRLCPAKPPPDRWTLWRKSQSLAALLPISGDHEAIPGQSAGTVSRQPYGRSEEHTSELQSLMRISYAVFCLKKKNHNDRLRTLAQTSPAAPATQRYTHRPNC